MTEPKVDLAGTRPALERGVAVEIREENIAPWCGRVASIKPSPVTGWWVEVVREDDGMTYAVTAAAVYMDGAPAPRKEGEMPTATAKTEALRKAREAKATPSGKPSRKASTAKATTSKAPRATAARIAKKATPAAPVVDLATKREAKAPAPKPSTNGDGRRNTAAGHDDVPISAALKAKGVVRITGRTPEKRKQNLKIVEAWARGDDLAALAGKADGLGGKFPGARQARFIVDLATGKAKLQSEK